MGKLNGIGKWLSDFSKDTVFWYHEEWNDDPPAPREQISMVQVRNMLEENIRLRRQLADKKRKEISANYSLIEDDR